MAEIWTSTTPLDDPDVGIRAVEMVRKFRDNDDALVRTAQTQQHEVIGAQSWNQTHPATIASGVKIRWFKPAYATEISFRFFVARTGNMAISRVWAKVRFNNDAGLETALFDSDVVSQFGGWSVVDFDVSSLAEGWYDAEIYVGTVYANGTDMTARLPSGGDQAEDTNPFDATTLYAVEIHEPDWTSSPASDVTDAQLTVEKGFTETIPEALYDRDEKLRTRPFGYELTEKSGSDPFTEHTDVLQIYVPLNANILHVSLEIYKTGGTASFLFYDPGHPFESKYRKSNQNLSNPAVPVGAYDGTLNEIQLNVAEDRGEIVVLRLRVWNTAGQTTFVRATPGRGKAWFSAGVLPSESATAPEWRNVPVVARDQGGLMSAGWWRRHTNRNRELLDRSMMSRLFSLTIAAGSFTGTSALDSRMTIFQPLGAGESGLEIAYAIEVAGTPFLQDLWIDYSDLPDGNPPSFRKVNAANGVHILTRPLLAARDGTEQIFSLFYLGGFNGTIYRTTEGTRNAMAFRTPR